MATENNDIALRKALSQDLMEVLVRFALIAFLVLMCYWIFAPFAGLMLWGIILAVALYPLQQWIAARLGDKQGGAATVLVLALLLLIGWPTVMLGGLFVESIHNGIEAFSTNSVTIPPPDASVAQWPLVGEKLFSAWSAAAADLPAFLERLQPQLGNLTHQVLAMAASTMGGILAFLAAVIIAGVMMAFGVSGSQATMQILDRLAGTANGSRIHKLTTGTIRSVATGVIGVAFIQALLLGLGFAFAGVPAAGLLAVIAMLFGIMQLPAVIIVLPVIGFLWWAGDASTTSNIVWSVYLILASLADNVLKPLLLGRGVEAPMPIILLGALGGMMSAGIVGLFVGAVLLAVGYQLFMNWVVGSESDGQEATTSE